MTTKLTTVLCLLAVTGNAAAVTLDAQVAAPIHRFNRTHTSSAGDGLRPACSAAS